MIKQKLRFISIFLLLIFLFEIIAPTISYALTSGPSQPEFQGFTEVDISQSVDPFTGDFSYQIPLLVVPGPNGGYPLNLTYSSGVGMEDEASWVGLGWSLTPGAINRSVRGIPDDFRGAISDTSESDYIKQTKYLKPNVTASIGVSAKFKFEIYGADFSGFLDSISVSPNANYYYNSYQGFGFKYGVNLGVNLVSSNSGGMGANLNVSMDASDGPSIQPSISLSSKDGEFNNQASFGMGYSSRQGVSGFNFSTSRSKQNRDKSNVLRKTSSTGASVSYGAESSVPSVNFPMEGFNSGFQMDIEAGPTGVHTDIPFGFSGNFSVSRPAEYILNGYDFPAFGTMYSDYRINNNYIENDRALMDFNLENEGPINEKVPILSMPILTHDIYQITGDGLGGVFRPYRNDAGIFYKPKAVSVNLGVNLGFEIASFSGFKAAVDPNVSFSRSYSGKWRNDDEKVIQMLGFKNRNSFSSSGIRKNEPYVFRFPNEFLANYKGEIMIKDIGKARPAMVDIYNNQSVFQDFSDNQDLNNNSDASKGLGNGNIFKDFLITKAKGFNSLNGIEYSSQALMNKEPRRRMNLIQYYTFEEASAFKYLSINNIYTGSYSSPNSLAFSTYTKPSYAKKHHVKGFHILKPDGSSAVYDTPLFNTVQKEIFFSIVGETYYQNGATSNPSKIIGYNSSILNNKKGDLETTDRMYTESETGPYVHTYLLSYVSSPDYIDVDNNGPSDLDLGYWAKFNYYNIDRGQSIFKWRAPFEVDKANYSSGHHSDMDDDRASIMYGEKEMTYMHSIETKTHVAFFYLSDRGDGLGVNGINGGAGSKRLKKLDKIALYSKNDLINPIKTVNFEYESSTNQLCKGIPNKNTSVSGKLTLKSVHFTFKNSKKGEQAKYYFDYGNIYKSDPQMGYLLDSTKVNKDYSYLSVDRWGMYSSNLDSENPYTKQTRDLSSINERKESAANWNLTKITLPTGAIIRIDYEMDDYSHVQNQEVTQMVKILGTGSFDDDGQIIADWLDNGNSKIRNKDRIIFFEPLDVISNSLSHSEKMKIIGGYINGLPDDLVYFKVWQRLQRKNNLGPWMADYVTGYAKLKKGLNNKPEFGYINKTIGPNTITIPYIVTEEADNPAKNQLRAAGLQYLRYSRSDLNRPSFSNNNTPSPIPIILGLFQVLPQLTELISGYYNASMLKGYSSELLDTKPSFLRLSNPNQTKFGGGSRVKKLTVSDEWTLNGLDASQYGSEYFYKTIDGKSSGVATYEPMIGNDENPMKRPTYYGPDNKFSNNNSAFFMESPIGEAYFPSPSVGYRRVVINNISNNSVQKTGDGINVKEFYTALEFPLKAEYNKQPQMVVDKFNTPIPFVGSISMSARGYSQGFYIELNDMHGKPKAEYLYDRDSWDSNRNDIKIGSNQIGYTKNSYQTIGKYNPNGVNELNSKIEVIDKYGKIDERTIGDVSEFFGHMAEDYTFNISAGVSLNTGVDPAPSVVFASGFPSISYSEESARIITTTKVVNKVGVLSEVTTYKDGMVQKTKNLYYDEETAQPILTSITDDYDNPLTASNDREIYTFQYPAHWYYSGMEPAYKNYRLEYKGDLNNIPYALDLFEVGDVIWDGSQHTFVTQVYENSINRVYSNNTPVPLGGLGKYLIIKSGKKNQQSASSGKLVSLKNPIPIISSYNWVNLFSSKYDSIITHNSIVANSVLSDYSVTPLELGSIKLCNGEKFFLTIKFMENRWLFEVYKDSLLTNRYCFLDYIFYDTPNHIYAKDVKFNILGDKTLCVSYPGIRLRMVKVKLFESCNDLFKACMDGVLHADATEYKDKWIYRKEFTSGFSTTFNALNAFLKGEQGIWRVKRVNSYFVERKQNEIDTLNVFGKTNIGYDGTYKRFIPFDWERVYNGFIGNANNVQSDDGWRWAAEIPENGYSPYGFEIENVNALGIYSSALYGYKNSLSTMVAQNAAYNEIGFDSFDESRVSSPPSIPYVSRGHLKLNFGNSLGVIIDSTSHTGNNSLFVNGSNNNSMYIDIPVYLNANSFDTINDLQFVKGKSYTISFWYKKPKVSDWEASIYSLSTMSMIGSLNLNNSSLQVENWRRFEYTFKIPSNLSAGEKIRLNIRSNNSVGNIIIDDLRISPANSSVTTYVYSPVNYVLAAQLDDNNYATFYNYDEEDNLTQVKKETERGVMTIKQTRKNVKK